MKIIYHSGAFSGTLVPNPRVIVNTVCVRRGKSILSKDFELAFTLVLDDVLSGKKADSGMSAGCGAQTFKRAEWAKLTGKIEW